MTDAVVDTPQQGSLALEGDTNDSGGVTVDTTVNTNTPISQSTSENSMSIPEIISDSVTGTINQARQAVLKSIWKKINSLCEKYDVSTDELINNIPPQEPVKIKKELSPDDKRHALKGIKLQAKYSDGVNSWSGRGLMPRFIREAMAKDPSLTLESFLVK